MFASFAGVPGARGVLRAVHDLRGVPELGGPPLRLVHAPPHVSPALAISFELLVAMIKAPFKATKRLSRNLCKNELG